MWIHVYHLPKQKTYLQVLTPSPPLFGREVQMSSDEIKNQSVGRKHVLWSVEPHDARGSSQTAALACAAARLNDRAHSSASDDA